MDIKSLIQHQQTVEYSVEWFIKRGGFMSPSGQLYIPSWSFRIYSKDKMPPSADTIDRYRVNLKRINDSHIKVVEFSCPTNDMFYSLLTKQ